jgi:hypothetical protein
MIYSAPGRRLARQLVYLRGYSVNCRFPGNGRRWQLPEHVAGGPILRFRGLDADGSCRSADTLQCEISVQPGLAAQLPRWNNARDGQGIGRREARECGRCLILWTSMEGALCIQAVAPTDRLDITLRSPKRRYVVAEVDPPMEPVMSHTKLSLGQAIDQIIGALEALESDARKTAIEAACAHLKITPVQVAPVLELRQDTPNGAVDRGARRLGPAAAGAPPTPNDIRSLRDQKNPKSAREMACVVAFYLQELAPEGERKEAIATADLEKYFKQANFKLPEKITQVLTDAKGAGYFDSASRGAYKLNAVGYNLVAHKLPATPAGA